ncbi:MAG: ATP-binding protein [Defluviitaleaceae bacterium]|nr:ATP-binding protein [Defluviitaleaceae bacterium]
MNIPSEQKQVACELSLNNISKLVLISGLKAGSYDDKALENFYAPTDYAISYNNEKEHQRDWMTFIALCLMSFTSYKIDYTNMLEKGDRTPNLPLTGMKSNEAINHVDCYPFAHKPSMHLTKFLEKAYAHIESRECATLDAETGIELRFLRLFKLLKLPHFTYFAIQCALSCSLDRGFENMFENLHLNENIPHPTLGDVQTLYSIAFPNRQVKRLGNKSAVENRILFRFEATDGSYLMRPLILRENVLNYLMGEQCISRELNSCAKIINNDKQISGPLFIDNQLTTAQNTFKKMHIKKEPRLCVLFGAVGSGKKLTLQWLAQEQNTQFIIVNLDMISKDINLDDLSDELLSLAIIEEVTLCFSMEDSDLLFKFPQFLSMIEQYNLGVFILSKSTLGDIAGFSITRINYPAFDLDKSLKFWQLFSSDYKTDSSIDWTQTASKYVLTAGQIKSALSSAVEMNEFNIIDEKAISSAVLLGNSKNLDAIADKIEAFYTWDDLIMSDASKQLLKDVCNRIKYRHVVEIQRGWKSAYGNGTSILFYGPPGTGKTMSAQVMAQELGLPLYRVNLSQIISKYIGETAKNISAVFNEAKISNIILFFDEADALFAKRTDVSNSNDRHANSESSFLLQQIEDYSGISILATNLFNNFDEAFRRRINYMINITKPDAARRLDMWKSVFPSQEDISPDLDLKLFADNLEFTGSSIKSAALKAAYFAAADGTQIDMKQLVRAARQELEKTGGTVPLFFGLYSTSTSH